MNDPDPQADNEEALDQLLLAIDAPPPPAATGLEGQVIATFGARRTSLVGWSVAGSLFAAAAALVVWSSIGSSPAITPRPSQEGLHSAMDDLKLRSQRVSAQLLQRRVESLEDRLHRAAEPTPDPGTDPLAADTTPDLDSLSDLERIGVLRLAVLEQTTPEHLGVAHYRRRCEELASTFDGTPVARRARGLLTALNR